MLRFSGSRPFVSSLFCSTIDSLETPALFFRLCRKKEAVATWEWFGEGTDTVSEGNGFLIDDEFFKGEGHRLSSNESRELRVDRRRCCVSAAAALLSHPYFDLLSTLSKLLLYFFGFAEKMKP